ncbi:acyltransferase [Stieleria sp. ICT_E10.1]|uniref:type IV pilus modification PilV family protein n=1 Tax=Stieleria sedimenti TaxID=2976331 RepID=UPI00218063A7|nr:acyltransferase [Stieleria sedimenti]MCS7469860.1 acyltransferase [Stieleria sedimenti]
MTRSHRQNHRRRQGYMLFEMLVAMAFLAAATGIALKTHQARMDYDRDSLDRLRRQLMIENLADQLASVPYSQISTKASELQSDSEAEVAVEPFEFESTQGLHLTIKMETGGRSLLHHLWRLEPTS